MIAQLIEEYVKQGGGKPYALLLPTDWLGEMPDEVFIVCTERVTGAMVLPLDAAKMFVHGRLFMKGVTADGD